MVKTTVKKKTARRKRDLPLEDAQRAKRRLRALVQAQRDMGRLASQLLRATDESRARLLALADAIAAEQGLELIRPLVRDATCGDVPRAEGPIERATNHGSIGTGPDRNRQEADVPLAFDGDDVADGARARA